MFRSQAVRSFKQGRYTDKIRELFIELLHLGVGTADCGQVISTILQKTLEVECDRLPKTSFVKYMY